MSEFNLKVGVIMSRYNEGDRVKVKITAIKPYGAFVQTPDKTDGLIHISEVMDDFVHSIGDHLSKGQIVVAKVKSIEPSGKLNLTLKDNEHFNKKKTTYSSVIDEVISTETLGFESLKQLMPEWIARGKQL